MGDFYSDISLFIRYVMVKAHCTEKNTKDYSGNWCHMWCGVYCGKNEEVIAFRHIIGSARLGYRYEYQVNGEYR